MRHHAIRVRRRPLTLLTALALVSAVWMSPAVVSGGAAPSVTAVHSGLAAGTLGPGIPIRTTWQVNDPAGTLARLEVQRRANDGPWYFVPGIVVTSTAATQFLASGYLHQYRARVIDDGGNASPWAMGQRFRITVLQETSPQLTYAMTWRHYYLDNSSAGQVMKTGIRGATAALAFSATDVGLVMTQAVSRGNADVTISGVAQGTLNLTASRTITRRILFIRSFPDAAARVLRLTVQPEPNHPYVDVDAVVLVAEH